MINIICILFKDNRREFIYGNDIVFDHDEIIISSSYGIHRYMSANVKFIDSINEKRFLEYEKNCRNNQRKQKNNK